MSSEFVHLHVHTEFSLLDGQSRIKALMQRAQELEMSAVAISDHGVMFGAIDFFRAARENDIKPVVGMEAYLSPRSMHQKDAQHDKKPFHMLLLAKNMTGYQNLLKIARASQLEGYYYRPRVDHDFLAEHAEGLVATTGCLAAEIPRMIEEGREQDAYNRLGWYADVFGAENFYLELQPHQIDQLGVLNKWLVEYRRSNHTPLQLMATNDMHYVRMDDADVHDTLLCIQTGALKHEQNRMKLSPHGSYYMKSADEMRRSFRALGLPDDIIAESFASTLQVAEMTEVELEHEGYHLPVFPVPPRFRREDGDDAGAYLRYLVEKGLSWRFPGRKDDPVLQQRIERELTIIGDMGFNTYFLIVWDLCEFARAVDIWWNVRGSGAGSLVAYCLGITNIDPIQNSLLFERFLNPGRVSMPDIDLDYPDDRRAEMIAYAVEKYGEEKVAAIITFGTMGAKAVVRDVGRALGVEQHRVNAAASLIPQEARQKSLQAYIDANPDLQQLIKTDKQIAEVMETAKKLQGLTRHASTHAAGVIISDRPLVDYLPLHRITGTDPSGGSLKQVTQFPMETAESIGLLKVDFLGLSTLTILRKACDLIRENRDIHYTMDNIPYRHDAPNITDEQRKMLDQAFEMMGRGETVGVFQVESPGMQSMLRGMRPKVFENVIAGISLYRPGPMEFIPQYNKRLHGEETIPYKHPKLKPIIEETMGILVYQEQIMQVAGELFGYDLGEADLMRRAVSKKKQKELIKHKAIFIERGPENDIPAEVAEAIFDEIEFFANYGFNKCVVGSTEIIDAATGCMVTVQDLYEGKAAVNETITCDTDSLMLKNGTIKDVMANGVRPVYRLTTRTGRQIDATANHPFLLFDGWRNLEDLSVGDLIATPRCLPVEGTKTWDNASIAAFAGQLDTLDELPVDLFELTSDTLLRVVDVCGITAQGLENMSGQRVRQQWRHLLSRLAVQQPAYAVGPVDEADNDIYWDAVASIEYIGEQPTYDLTIDGTHNFVANDIIVHNSHASDYAVITVQTAFLKAHYPEEFMTALLCVQFDDSAKVATFLEECRRLQIPVLPPDVNYSKVDFAIEMIDHQGQPKRAIRFGLGAIKNAGMAALQHIIDEREANGPFASLVDLCHRVNLRKEVGKRALESLIKVGALSQWGARDAMLEAVERIVGYSGDYHHDKEIGQMNMFGADSGFGDDEAALAIGEAKTPISNREQLGWEKELTGIYVTGRPVDKHRELFAALHLHIIQQLLSEPELHHGKQVKVGGEIVNVRKMYTKTGDAMAVLMIEDWHDTANSLEVVLFPKTYKRVSDAWEESDKMLAEGEIVVVQGAFDTSRPEPQIKADNVLFDLDVMRPDHVGGDAYPSADETVPAWANNGVSYDASGSVAPVATSMDEPPPWNGAPYEYDEETGEIAPEPETHHNGIKPLAADAVRAAEPHHTLPDGLPYHGHGSENGHSNGHSNGNGHGNGNGHANGSGHGDDDDDDHILKILQRQQRYHLTIHFKRSDNTAMDRRRLTRLHGHLIKYPGKDRFTFVIEGERENTVLEFPNHTTGLCDDLLADITSVIGPNAVDVVPLLDD